MITEKILLIPKDVAKLRFHNVFLFTWTVTYIVRKSKACSPCFSAFKVGINGRNRQKTRLTRCPNEKNIKSILHPDENRANFTDIMKGYCRSKLLLFFPY